MCCCSSSYRLVSSSRCFLPRCGADYFFPSVSGRLASPTGTGPILPVQTLASQATGSSATSCSSVCCRFYLGGPTSIRGFSMYSLGPQSEGQVTLHESRTTLRDEYWFHVFWWLFWCGRRLPGRGGLLGRGSAPLHPTAIQTRPRRLRRPLQDALLPERWEPLQPQLR